MVIVRNGNANYGDDGNDGYDDEEEGEGDGSMLIMMMSILMVMVIMMSSRRFGSKCASTAADLRHSHDRQGCARHPNLGTLSPQFKSLQSQLFNI